MAQQEKRYRISLSVTEEEYELIKQKAEHTGFKVGQKSGSARYVKALALGYTVKSVFDLNVMLEIGKLHRDLGRCGGLLKKCVEDGLTGKEVYEYIGELLQTRREISAYIQQISDGYYSKRTR